MKLHELLQGMKGKPCVLNGLKGKLAEITEEYVVLECLEKRNDNYFRETVIIPLNKIETISEGWKKLPKPKAEEMAEKELEELVK